MNMLNECDCFTISDNRLTCLSNFMVRNRPCGAGFSRALSMLAPPGSTREAAKGSGFFEDLVIDASSSDNLFAGAGTRSGFKKNVGVSAEIDVFY